MEFELPALEDIYDYGETELRNCLSQIEDILANPSEQLTQKWLSKASRIKELIEIEVDERISVNQIAMFCANELNSDLYKELFTDDRASTDESTQNSVADTAEDTAYQMWQLHRGKKNVKDRKNQIRETLKRTQIQTGLVIGSSSVKPVAKPPMAVRNRPEEIKSRRNQPVEKKGRNSLKSPSPKPPVIRQRTISGKSMTQSKPSPVQMRRQPVKKFSQELPQSSTDSEPVSSRSTKKIDKPLKLREEVIGNNLTDFQAKPNQQVENFATTTGQQNDLQNIDQLQTIQREPVQQLSSDSEESELYEIIRDESDVQDKNNCDEEQALQVTNENIDIQIQEDYNSKIVESSETARKINRPIQKIDQIKQEHSSMVQQEFHDKPNQLITEEQQSIPYSEPRLQNKQSIEIATKYFRIQNKPITTPEEDKQPSPSSSSSVSPIHSPEPIEQHPIDTNEFIQEYEQKLQTYQTEKQEPLNFTQQTDVKKAIQDAKLKSNTQKIDINEVSTPVTSEPKPKPTRRPVVRSRLSQPIEDPNAIDYSDCIKTFAEIFAGQGKVKEFNYANALRDCLQVFKEFTNTMSSPEFELQRKFKLSLAPLELNPRELIKNSEALLRPTEVSDRQMYYRVVRARPEVYDIVSRAFNKKRGWSELPHGMNLRHSWNIMWTWSKPRLDLSKLLIFQKVNHFPNTRNFSRKDLLKKNLEKIMRMSNKCGQVWNILPSTYILPKEYIGFIEEYTDISEKSPQENIWIMKPVGKSRGRGISLINDINQVNYGEPMVIQRYLTNPLLLSGFKFDLRIYVLITNINPLEAFLYKEGFARLSTVPFSLNPEKLQNKYIHLTNSSIQKHNHRAQTDPVDQMFGGTKISLKSLRDRLGASVDYQRIWKQIREIIIKSLISVQNEIPSYSCCFDLVGFDIIIDSNMKAWLIEINSSPSLARDNFLDDMIKQQLIDDTLDLVEPPFINHIELVKVLERRLNEVQKGHFNNSTAVLNSDMTRIMEGRKLRKYGDTPEKLGNYEVLAPSPEYDKLLKLAYPRLFNAK